MIYSIGNENCGAQYYFMYDIAPEDNSASNEHLLPSQLQNELLPCLQKLNFDGFCISKHDTSRVYDSILTAEVSAICNEFLCAAHHEISQLLVKLILQLQLF